MADFFEYKAPQYVSSFSPINLDMIHTGYMEKYQDAQKNEAILGEALDKLGDEPTYDQGSYDEYMKNVRKASDSLVSSQKGDLAGAFGKIRNLISSAKKDPFLKYNKLKVDAVNKQREEEAKIRASGKQPLIFKDVTQVPIIQDGKYTHPDAFVSDIQTPLEYTVQMGNIWKSILTQQGGESRLGIGKNTPAGLYEQTSWEGISDKQFGHKREQGFTMYKGTDEYRQQVKVLQQQGLTDTKQIDKVIQDQFDAIGTAMTTDAIKRKTDYREIPGYTKALGSGRTPFGGVIPLEPTSTRAMASNIQKADLTARDLVDVKDNDSKKGIKTLINIAAYANPKLKGLYSDFSKEVTKTIYPMITKGTISMQDVEEYPSIVKILKHENLSPNQYAELKREVNELTSTDLSTSVQPTMKGMVIPKQNSPLFTALKNDKISQLGKNLEAALDEVLEKAKTNGMSMPVYTKDSFAGTKEDQNFFDTAIRTTMTDNKGSFIDVNTGKALTDLGVTGFGENNKYIFNKDDNKIYIETDLLTSSKLPNSNRTIDGITDSNRDRLIRIDDTKFAQYLLSKFDAATKEVASNALSDVYSVDANGDMLDKNTGDKIPLSNGMKVKLVEADDGYHYETQYSNGKPYTLANYIDDKFKDEASKSSAIKAYGESGGTAEGLNKPFMFPSTYEIKKYFK